MTRNSDTPSTIRPHGQSPVAKSAIAPIMPKTASTSRTPAGGTPKYRRSETCGSTGVGPSSAGGTSWTTVSPEATAVPHSGQNLLFAGSFAPQV